MGEIAVLDKQTIDKIAAGEVVERPSSVVKELTENAIDAGASVITVEIKEGGCSLIRITDNGSGIQKDEIRTAFLSHATSKIRTVEDLLTANSLGFRGEALPSIASVAKVEVITKTPQAFSGCRIEIDGGIETHFEEVGCPDGTTFLVRDLFYNIPARRKFLKSSMTEAGYCFELIQRLAICNPMLSFRFINNGKVMLQTSGNGNLLEIIYQLYGREVSQNSLSITHTEPISFISIQGFIGKPIVSRGNRNYENYFVNGRYIRSSIIGKALEEAYRPYLMQHKYPCTNLLISMDSKMLDVNVHPTKLEVRFADSEAVYYAVYHAVKEALLKMNMIPKVSFGKEEPLPEKEKPEPISAVTNKVLTELYPKKDEQKNSGTGFVEETQTEYRITPEKKEAFSAASKVERKSEQTSTIDLKLAEEPFIKKVEEVKQREEKIRVDISTDITEKQEELIDILKNTEKPEFRIIGQAFKTYLIVEMKDQLFLIDQHAAHEKVLYEETMQKVNSQGICTQQLSPPFIVTLNLKEISVLEENAEILTKLGFEFEAFGGKDYKITGIPSNLCGINADSFLTLLDEIVEDTLKKTPEQLLMKVASLSCKAAVKGNQTLSVEETKTLIERLLTLKNPYQCPHGRPTTITMSKQELEKKFKRIVS